MDLMNLPQAMFVVGQSTANGGASVKGCKDTSGRSGIFIWTSRHKASDFSARLAGPSSVMEIDRDFHLWKWIEDTRLAYCVVDRAPVDPVLDSEPVPAERLPENQLLPLTGDPVQVLIVENVARRQGVDEVVISAIRQVGMTNLGLRPSELLQRVRELADELVQRDKEREEVMAALSPAARRAFERLIPQEPCGRCGERQWLLEGTAPSGRAAKWKCEFCGKKTIVHESEATPKPGPRREAISKEVQREVWQRDRGRCVECGDNEKLEFDHIIPVSKGGSSTARNIQLLCEPCNRRKSASIG